MQVRSSMYQLSSVYITGFVSPSILFAARISIQERLGGKVSPKKALQTKQAKARPKPAPAEEPEELEEAKPIRVAIRGQLEDVEPVTVVFSQGNFCRLAFSFSLRVKKTCEN